MEKHQGRTKRQILIVDDHPVVREGLRRLINRAPDLNVSDEAEDVASGLEIISKKQPDIVIVDISMKGRSGLELVREVNLIYPDLPVLVLSVHDESVYAERVLMSGARGYIMKKEAANDIIDAIHKVLSGEVYLSQTMTSKVLHRLTKGKPISPLRTLTNREIQVLELLGRGLTLRQIARKINVSYQTVTTYTSEIKKKLKLKDRSELLPYAIQWVRTEEAADSPAMD